MRARKGGGGWWWYGMKRGCSDSEARPTIQQTVILCHVRLYLRNTPICARYELHRVKSVSKYKTTTMAGLTCSF